MSHPNQAQIDAVRALQQILAVQGTLSDQACLEYLDWHMKYISPSARPDDINSPADTTQLQTLMLKRLTT